MPKPSPEQQRISELEHALEISMYHVLRCYRGGIFGEDDESTQACRSAYQFLRNHGLEPYGKAAKALLKRPMEAYHFELEKAVKRAVSSTK